ncbi:hypothetical protein P154DRAFT_218453 [Amniculicola lignicola CBS 123094]|uniref:Uncharacterized protein n=1 Tax=Amniculicola lignicola CBS 123094 TaxID=1392246 RepID=A0A6A5WZ90_9PLEO|nr:hypothetical protein P154DRAFT_218453 [Amniculicola lignicola CBS 123094]
MAGPSLSATQLAGPSARITASTSPPPQRLLPTFAVSGIRPLCEKRHPNAPIGVCAAILLEQSSTTSPPHEQGPSALPWARASMLVPGAAHLCAPAWMTYTECIHIAHMSPAGIDSRVW